MSCEYNIRYGTATIISIYSLLHRILSRISKKFGHFKFLTFFELIDLVVKLILNSLSFWHCGVRIKTFANIINIIGAILV